jgi:hypothetical protein
MTSLPAASVEHVGDTWLQNLTHTGMSLEGIPNAYQGRRLRFGSCSMAAALTQLNGYAMSRRVVLSDLNTPPFYELGKLTPRRRAMVFQTVGEADEAVEKNFTECHASFAASAEGMADCLAQKLGRSSCIGDNLKTVACPSPKVDTFEGSVDERRAYLRAHFNQADAARIVPLTFPWDTRLVLGPPQTWDGDVKFVHVSAVIGRRLTAPGKCEVLIRNSWGTCSSWKQQYPIGACDNLGKTDDVWVDSEAFLKRSGELTSMHD